MFALTLAVALIAAVLSPADASTACFKSRTSGLTDPNDIIGTYVGSPELVEKFLLKFKRSPSLKGYFDAINAAASSKHPVCGMVSWELGFFSSAFLGKHEPERICCLSEVVDRAIDFDKTGNKESFNCVVDLLLANTEDAVHNTIELLLEQFGCGNKYQKPSPHVPACVNLNCANGGRVGNWDDIYKIIKRDFEGAQVPWFDQFYKEIQSSFKSNDKNRWGMALASIGTWLHTTYLLKFGVGTDHLVLDVATKLVSFMEQVAFSKPCNCNDRLDFITKAGDELLKTVRLDMDLIRSKV